MDKLLEKLIKEAADKNLFQGVYQFGSRENPDIRCFYFLPREGGTVSIM
jgi:hypothetical protein